MKILTSLQKLAGAWQSKGLRHLATGIVSALAVCTATSALGQVTVTTLGGGPGSADVGTTPGSSIITFSGGSSGAAGIALDNPLGMAFDSAGNLYIAENGQGNILKVSNPGNQATSFTFMFATGLNSPVDVEVAANGDVYVLTSPSGGGSIVRYTSEGVFVSTITTALVNPTGFVILSSGDFVVTEIAGPVKQVTPTGNITLLNGGSFVNPTGISHYSGNRVAIADGGDHSIKLLNLTNSASPTLLAGGNGAGFTNGLALTSQFNTPRAISFAPNGSLVVADQNNHRVRIISTDGRVETVYGVSTNSWLDNPFYQPSAGLNYPGWKDGTNAHANQPFGVVVGIGATNVFVTEIGHPNGALLRMASGFSLVAPSGTNTTTTNVFVDTTITNCILTLGFSSGEASSDYEGFPGQTFQVPVTLTMPTAQKIYSMGFTIGVTNIGGNPLAQVGGIGFDSKLQHPFDDPAYGEVYKTILPRAFTGYLTNIVTNPVTGESTTNFIPQFATALITNSVSKIMAVSWIEMPGAGILYPAEQDLVTSSIAFFNNFAGHSLGKVILGSFSFKIPDTAPIDTEYRVQVYNASATEEINRGFDILTPTNANALALGPGNINSIKRIIVKAPRTYLVGDLEGFRWYNVGEFGDRSLKMVDVQEAYVMAAFGLNKPLPDSSDLYNAVDSYNTNSMIDPLTGNIDLVRTGDGQLTMDDVLTTLRRSLDPTVSWVYRFPGGIYASNGVGVPMPDFGTASASAQLAAANTGSGNTTVAVKVQDVIQAGGNISVPIYAKVTGTGRPNRMMLSLVVEQHGGAPSLLEAVGYIPGSSSLLGVPGTSGNSLPVVRQGKNGLAVFWNETTGFGPYPGLVAGDNLILTLGLKPSRTLQPGEYYRIKVTSFSVSPGYAYRTVSEDGLVSPISLSAVSSLSDGISDAWRNRFFYSTFNADTLADADPDGDGVPNWKEYLAGTNPMDNTSAFKLATSQVNDGAGVTIRFMTVIGKQYVVESCASIGSPWTPVGSTVTGTGGEVVVTDNSPGANSRFYRIRLIDGNTAAY